MEVHTPCSHPLLPWFPSHFTRGKYPLWGEGYEHPQAFWVHLPKGNVTLEEINIFPVVIHSFQNQQGFCCFYLKQMKAWKITTASYLPRTARHFAISGTRGVRRLQQLLQRRLARACLANGLHVDSLRELAMGLWVKTRCPGEHPEGLLKRQQSGVTIPKKAA